MKVLPIKNEETHDWLLRVHYARRIPSISYAFGLFDDHELLGVVTYGSPPSPTILEGIAGKKNSSIVLELNRLVFVRPVKNGPSLLVSHSLKFLPKPTIVVSYADCAKGHVGYVYQSTNFLYTGLSAKRTNPKNSHGLHSRTVWKPNQETIERPRKHRYVYMVGGKSDRKKLLKNLKYKVQDYPKSENVNYNVGNIPPSQILLL